VLTIVVVLVVAALVLAGAGVAVFGGSSTKVTPPTAPSATAPAARQLLRAALAAATRADSFHYVATSTVSGPDGYSQRTVGDAGPDSGRQVITIGSQRFTVLVVGTACYVSGNAPALTAQLGLSSSEAAAHAGQWISLATTDPPYASVYAAVTAPSALADNITVAPKDQLPRTRVDGRRVETITGAITPIEIDGQKVAPKGTATLAVRVRAPHLPVRYTQKATVDKQPSVSAVAFNRWGETVAVTAPTGAVAYASLAPGSGTTPSTPGSPVLT
jgi:hypothetical protein